MRRHPLAHDPTRGCLYVDTEGALCGAPVALVDARLCIEHVEQLVDELERDAMATRAEAKRGRGATPPPGYRGSRPGLPGAGATVRTPSLIFEAPIGQVASTRGPR